MHKFSTVSPKSLGLPVLIAKNGKNLRNVGGTSGAEQLDP